MIHKEGPREFMNSTKTGKPKCGASGEVVSRWAKVSCQECLLFHNTWGPDHIPFSELTDEHVLKILKGGARKGARYFIAPNKLNSLVDEVTNRGLELP